jgi:hypothetical protein
MYNMTQGKFGNTLVHERSPRYYNENVMNEDLVICPQKGKEIGRENTGRLRWKWTPSEDFGLQPIPPKAHQTNTSRGTHVLLSKNFKPIIIS